MNHVLTPFLRKGPVVFIDDILVYTTTWAQHLQLLKSIFQVLLQNKISIKLSKCSFAQKQLKYLGHIICATGVATDP